MQSKKHSHIEVITNQVLGIVIGWSLVYFAFPAIGLQPTVEQATLSSGMFFVASYARSYSVRRVFNWIAVRAKK